METKAEKIEDLLGGMDMKRDLKEAFKPIQQSIETAMQEIKESKAAFDLERDKKLNEAKEMLDKVRQNGALRLRKAKSLKKELAELTKQQSNLADQIVSSSDEQEVARLEKELMDLSAQRMTLEVKINAFNTHKSGFMDASQRHLYLKTLAAYDAVEYQENTLDDLTALQEHLNELLDGVKKAISLEKFNQQQARSEKIKSGESRLDEMAIPLFADEEKTKPLKQKDIVFHYWLNDKRNITFEDFIPLYLENERLRNEKWQREQDERKLKEAREREERNAKARAVVESRLGGGHHF